MRPSKFGKKRKKKKKKAKDSFDEYAYWSVHRDESFTYNGWTQMITQEALDEIQSVAQCKEAISMMGYPKVNSGVAKNVRGRKTHNKIY